MEKEKWLAEQFEAHRDHLQRVAYRMLGSTGEADDAVQEAWLRLSRAEAAGIDNLGGWLTTVVARVCLDTLRSRKSRREEPLDGEPRARRRPSSARPIPSAKPSLPTMSAWRCSSSSRRWRRPNGSPSCCTTCSTCRSRRSRPSSAVRRRRRGSSPAAPAAACAARRRRRRPTSPVIARSSTPSWRQRAAAIWRAFSPCSIRMSCCMPTAPPCNWAASRN